ncbi:heterokaryon incompatibility protein [Apiospora arundinis]
MSKTCELCRGFQRDRITSRLFLECKPDELIKSVEDNHCPSCGILLEGLRLKQDDSWSLKDVSTLYGYGFRDDNTLILEIYFIEDRPRAVLEFYHAGHHDGICGQPLPWKAIKPRTPFTSHPMSDQALSWVKSKLQTCIDTHECYDRANSHLPHRILAFDASDECISVRLMVSEPATSGKYAALSHCWGQSLRCKLTSANLEDRKVGIPWEELPRTFQDAIRYCLRLDIHYMWIDALCIIQDYPEDWQRESAKMAEIYGNSFITLAATAAACGDEGLFPKEPRLVEEPVVCWKDPTGHVFDLGVRRRRTHWSFPLSDSSKEENPLLTRGNLEPDHRDPSSSSGIIPQICDTLLPEPTAHGIEPENPSVDSIDSLKRVGEDWIHIVEQYSALSLTRDTDRLPALSGLAARTAMTSTFLGHQGYKAGLWEQWLRRHLTWRVDNLPPGLRRAEYRGPSWSWVSVDAQVRFWDEEELNRPLLVIQSTEHEQWDMQRDERRVTSNRNANEWDLDEWDLDEWDEDERERDQWEKSKVPLITSCVVKSEGYNPFGEVSAAALGVTGLLQQVALGRKWGTLELKASGWNRPVTLTFFPDYCLDYDNKTPRLRESDVTLFMLFPQVALVLVKLPEQLETPTYRRIGIINVGSEGLLVHHTDWMKGAEQQSFVYV